MSNLIPFADLIGTPTQGDVETNILDLCADLGLPTSTWQSGDPGLTMIQVYSFQESDTYAPIVAAPIQGGFLDYAALVTPDPSITPGVAPGWLDVLASSVYQLSNTKGGIGRIAATNASGNLVFANSGNAQGPFAAGTYHVANPATQQTYSNALEFTIGVGTTTAAFVADAPGSGSTSGSGTITQPVVTSIGVTVTNPAPLVGSNAESNAQVVVRCRSKLGSLSPNGPKAAYDYVSKTIPLPPPATALASGALTTPSSPVTRTRQVPNIWTGMVTNYVASANGAYVAPNAYTGSVDQTITSISTANPAVVDLPSHGYSTGDNVYFSGTGIVAIDGSFFAITVTGSNTFTIPLSGGTGSSAGTAYRQSDMDLIDKTVQAYCVPLGVPAANASASANTINVTGTIYLKKTATSTPARAKSDASAALAAYFATLPIGGDNIGGSSTYFFIEPMQAAISNSIYLPTGSTLATDVLRVIISSPSSDVSAAPTDVAALGTVSWTVVGET